MLKSLYISRFFFIAFGMSIVLIVTGFYLPVLLYFGQFSLIVLLILTILDGFLLFNHKNPIAAKRNIEARLNLGDETLINISIKNKGNQPYRITVFDEPPFEMQARDLTFNGYIKAGSEEQFSYTFKPTERGEYEWKNLHVFIRSFINLLERRIIIEAPEKVLVYPSILQMKNFEFLIFNQQTQQRGIKKIRRLGHNNEFEQIKNYIQGDDIRTVNWKATSRRSELMVNQFQAQRSQSVYAVIDKSRSMEHRFEGLTLLDHAINSTLIFSNIALKKGDKIGLVTFSHKLGTQIAPNLGKRQLQRILDALFAQKTEFKESNYSLLYQSLRKTIPFRSLLMLYTNFETELAMHRALPMLKSINKRHVLVVIFFKNTDLNEELTKSPTTARELYVSTLAEDVINTKKRIAKELNRHGIQTVLTAPNELNVDTLNKYLELKSRGLI
ncbi:DUF58 domain-containing protein [Brumimicrobium glaciale]|uniref:DUF58 domain-containing protein n=2 Tax=Brumimicrobium glaciale TaxID=200475 RepID=A0A4Q4KQ08_9FLAO|nr:DUF58 domain-containing protein [Brumimicrobium glaciale]